MKKRKLFVGFFAFAALVLGLASCKKKPVETETPGNQQQEEGGQQQEQKTLSSIELAGGTAEFKVGDSFNKGKLVVTAKYSDNSSEVVTTYTTAVADSKGAAVTGAFAAAGTYTVTVTYEGKTASYSVTVKEAKTLTGIEVNELNAKVEYEVGDTFSAAGLKVKAKYSEGNPEEVTGYTTAVADSKGAAVTGAFETAGTYTVTVTYEGKTDSYEVTVIEKQALVIFAFSMADWDGEYSNKTIEPNEVIYEYHGTKIVNASPSGKNRLTYQFVDSNNDSTGCTVDGVKYPGRLSSGSNGDTTKNVMKVTTTGACTIRILASGNKNQERDMTLAGVDDTSYSESKGVNEPKEVFTFDVPAAGEYWLYNGGSGGIYYYAITFEYSYPATEVELNKEMSISGYDTNFTTTGDGVFNFETPAGLVVKSVDSKGGIHILTEGYEVSVKKGTEAVTAITTPGVYTVTISIPGTELSESYEITVTNPNATLTELTLTTSADTVKKYYGTDTIDLANLEGLTLVVKDSDNLEKPLTLADCDVKLLKGEAEVTAFTTSGAYTVKVVYGTVSATYTVDYYAFDKYEIDVTEVSTSVAKDITSDITGFVVNETYEETEHKKNVTASVTATISYYSDAECTAANKFENATAAFANVGTVYAVISAGTGDKAVQEKLTLTVSVQSNNASFDCTTLTASADQEAIADGTKLGDGFFTVVGSAAKRYKEDKGVTSVEFGKNKSALSFTVTATVTVKIGVSSTSGTNSTEGVGIYVKTSDGKYELAPNTEATTVIGSSVTELAYTLPAGTYYIFSPNTSRTFRLFTVSITESAN